jgi:non-hemolytic enterotoxin B/C
MENSVITKVLDTQDSRIATVSQTSQGLIVQNYCNSVLQQPKIDFSGIPNLQSFQDDINSGLTKAQEHAQDYLSNIAPNIILTLTNIDNYYTLVSEVPNVLPPGSTINDWIETLFSIKEASVKYQQASKNVVINLGILNTNIAADAAAFAQIVKDLNTFMDGDNGTLESLRKDLENLDSQIGGAITGIVFGSIGVALGVFMIVVGAVADLVTAGASSELVIGGVGVLVTGIGGIAGSAILLDNLYSQKASIIREQSSLTNEVNFALGASTAYKQLYNNTGAALEAVQQMQNAWNTIVGDLDNLIQDLQNGIITDVDKLRQLFLAAADSDLKAVLEDIQIIKKQMSGVQKKDAPKDETIGQYLLTLASMN